MKPKHIRRPCRWCTGEIATCDETQTVSHTAPLCEGFARLLAVHTPDALSIMQLDDSGVVHSETARVPWPRQSS